MSIPAEQQVKWIRFPSMLRCPSAYTEIEEGSWPNKMSTLLLQDEVLQQAVDRIPGAIDFWQKEIYLKQALGIANFDPDEDPEFGELMRAVEYNSQMLTNPYISCKDRANMSSDMFQGAVKLREFVDKYNSTYDEVIRTVGFLLPEQIRFAQGQNIIFKPQVNEQEVLQARIWIPPSVHAVPHEVDHFKTHGSNTTATTYWYEINVRPVGGEDKKDIEVSYRDDKFGKI